MAKKEKKKTTTRKKTKKHLVIVESPAKAATIKRYLGKGYEVKASVGHVIDLPKSKLGIDIENNFKLQLITIKGKGSIVKELKAAAKKADTVFLAPDPDREGEAIAQHISDVINSPEKVYRILFNEITKKAVNEAINNPRKIDTNKVEAQQARRALDRLVGYKISPLLWAKVRRGLSAGRVQSVAMRILVDREKEIKAFDPKEYWSIKCLLATVDGKDFEAKLHHIDGKKFEIGNETDAKGAVDGIKKEPLKVASVTLKDKKRNPVAPFITSTLQQAASQRFRFNARRTMGIAQALYEGKEVEGKETTGLITYMRTDSTRVADEALAEVRGYIEEKIGKDFLPDKPNTYKSKKSAQDAHEAVRPTSVARTPESIKGFLKPEEFKLYDLIWKRFVASQMMPAINTVLTVDIGAGRYTLRASGSNLKFEGFLKVYGDEESSKKDDEKIIPPLEEGHDIKLGEITPNQHFTQPPPRFSEATLIRELEEKGIGRPSTYAAIMHTIQNRDYAESIERRLHPTELGTMITELLEKHFPTIMDIEFTAHMEEDLDLVEEGKKDWHILLKEFYEPFSKALEAAEKNMVKQEQKTDEKCDKCGSDMIIKFGRFGKFMACTAYPECKTTKPLAKDGTTPMEPEVTGDKCPTCGADMVLKFGRFGKFIACSKYPDCKTTKAITLGIKCPKKCGGEVVERKTKKKRNFYGCENYPKCDFVSWEKPVDEECPTCKNPFLVYGKSKNEDVTVLRCPLKECDFKKEVPKENTDSE